MNDNPSSNDNPSGAGAGTGSSPETKRSNIILIGMPGSGKSTVGVILAKLTARNFVDTDILIQIVQGTSLQEIVDNEGHMALRMVEERVLLDLDRRNHVIATGGSAPYSRPAMLHLKKCGIIVFLNVDLSTLEARIDNFETRGLAKKPNQSLAELFDERLSLYRQYADITIDSVGSTQEDVCAAIIRALREAE